MIIVNDDPPRKEKNPLVNGTHKPIFLRPDQGMRNLNRLELAVDHFSYERSAMMGSTFEAWTAG